MAEWLGNGLQNHAQQFDSAWHLDLLVISFSEPLFLCPVVSELLECCIYLMNRESHDGVE